VHTLSDAGGQLGLAFQIVDDILDATASTEALGKTAGKDARAGKATFVSVHGLASAREQAAVASAAAIAALRQLPGDPTFLVDLVQSMSERTS
jgi:geranylgeranyl pyrophosphate synthase